MEPNFEYAKQFIENFKKNSDWKAQLFEVVVNLILDGDVLGAKSLMQTKNPFIPNNKFYQTKNKIIWKKDKSIYAHPKRKNFSKTERIEIFRRDYYQCRYSGIKLLYPGIIELLSLIMPNEFPYKYPPNGPLHKTHIDVWTMFPGIDHVHPVSIFYEGDINHGLNVVTTSSIINSFYKKNIPLPILGWPILDMSELNTCWDGLENKFLYLIQNKANLENLIQESHVEKFSWYLHDIKG